MKKVYEKLFILSDSKSAINCIRQRSTMRHFHSILSRIRSAVHLLQGLGVKVVISWIPSHSGIYNTGERKMVLEGWGENPQ